MKFIVPKKWSEFQHYKDRSPPWIKLHKALLDDYDFQMLPIASRALAPMLWLLASEYGDGKLPAEPRKIAFRLHMVLQDLSDAFEPLIKGGFFEIIGRSEQSASMTLAEYQQHACLETETQVEKKETETQEQVETEKRPVAVAPLPISPKRNSLNGSAGNFEAFYAAYPLRVKRRAAEKAYISALKRAPPDVILAGAKRYRDDPKRLAEPKKFTAHPTSWLNADCWLDETEDVPAEDATDRALRKLQEFRENGSQNRGR